MKRQYLSALLVVVLVVTSISFLVSCKDYGTDIGSLQSQIDKAALTTDVQTLKSQVEANAQKELATADTAKKAFEQAAANAIAISSNAGNISGNTANIEAIKKSIEAINKDMDATDNTIKENAQKAAARIDSLARAGAVTDTKIADLQKSTKAAADSAASALAKNQELLGRLTDVSTQLSGEIKNIQTTLQQWAEAKSEYYTADEINNMLDIVACEIEDAFDDLDDLRSTVEGYQVTVNALYTAVTSISLYINSDTDAKNAFRLKFVRGQVSADYTFGKKEKDDVDTVYTATPTYEYKRGTFFSISRSLMVRVNPVNAKLTPSMIKLIDSEGNNLDDILEVKSVERYDGLLTKASSTGLWLIQLKLKDGIDHNTADKLDPSGTKRHIAYALAVNNTLSQSESISDAANRYVVSSYDITMEGTKDYKGATNIDSVRICPEGDKGDARLWKNLGNLKANKDTIHAHTDEDILIDFSHYVDSVDRFYVAVDYGHSKVGVENLSDEWKSYSYSGLNTVYEVDANTNRKISVQLRGNTIQSFVRFRIFAVSCDGSLVEKNGASFLVTVGVEASEASAEGDLVASTGGKMTTDWLPISGTLTKEGKLPASVEFTGNEGYDRIKIPATVTYAADENGTSIGNDISKAKYVKIAISSNLQYWTDGTSLTTILKGTDEENLVVNKISVKLTKVMPTVEDVLKLTGYSRKTQYFSNDIYAAYVIPSIGSSYINTWGYPVLWNAISAFKPVINLNKLDDNFGVSIENANLIKDDDYQCTTPLILQKSIYDLSIYFDFRISEKESENREIAMKLIDAKTQHNSEVYYSFGQISSEKDVNGDYIENLKVVLDRFQTIFTCPFDEGFQKYEWVQYYGKDVNVLTYNNPQQVVNVNGHSILECLKATNERNSSYSLTLDKFLNASAFNVPRYQKEATAHLYVENTTSEVYFTATIANGVITFIPVSGASEPTADVKCTFHIELKDIFGHTHKYDLPFVVKKP